MLFVTRGGSFSRAIWGLEWQLKKLVYMYSEMSKQVILNHEAQHGGARTNHAPRLRNMWSCRDQSTYLHAYESACDSRFVTVMQSHCHCPVSFILPLHIENKVFRRVQTFSDVNKR